MVTIATISLIILIILLVLGVPLPFCFGGALLFMNIVGDVAMKGMMVWGLQQILSPVLLCAPLFIFAGGLMSESGIAKYLLDFVDVFVGRIKGGLGVVAIVACAVIGAITGSSFTGIAATAPIMVPRMVEKGYPRGYAAALITDASILGILIPPSITMIIYGWVTETSILACFLATVGPGILIVILMSTVNIFWSRHFPLVIDPPITRREKWHLARTKGWEAIPALMMPIIILGGIYGGIMTPTEAAGIAAVYAIPVGFLIYKGLTVKNFLTVAKDAAVSVGAILFMIFICLMLSQTYLMLRLPQAIVEAVFGLTQNKTVLLILINVFLLIIGMIVNDITAIILVAPLLMPLVKAIGIDPVHFAAIVCVNLGVGGVTPPYASVLYLGMKVGKVEFTEILKPAMAFVLIVYMPALILTTYLPELSLWLPRLLGYVR